MADPKSIHEFLPTSGNIGSLFLVDDPDSQATSGYVTRQVSMDDVGEMVNNGIDYTQDLSTENKKVIGALNELHGVDGYDVYDNTATYAVGDICIHSNSLQVCTTAVTVAEDFDSTKWSPTSLNEILSAKANSNDVYSKSYIDNALPAMQIISAKFTSALTANQSAVFDYAFTVPTGYKIISCWDDSYYANVQASIIRINNSTFHVAYNYIATANVPSREWQAKAVIAKNVTGT